MLTQHPMENIIIPSTGIM